MGKRLGRRVMVFPRAAAVYDRQLKIAVTLILISFKKNPARIQLAFQRQPARLGSARKISSSARLAKFQLEGTTSNSLYFLQKREYSELYL